MPKIAVKNLVVTYQTRKTTNTVISDLSVAFPSNKISVIIGESGSGKSTLAKTLLRLTDGHVRTSGVARIGNLDVMSAHGRALQDLHRFAQIVFQDPFSSFDPRMSVGACIAEGITALGVLRDKDAIFERVGELL